MSLKALKIIEGSDRRLKYPLELNPGNSEHAEYIAECFGGEEHFKNNYPDLYKLYQNGIARSEKGADGTEEVPREGFVNAAYIADVLYIRKDKCAYAVGDMNLTDKAKRLYLSMDIYKDDKLIAHNVEYYNDETYGDVECFSEPFDIPEGEVQRYKALLTVAWQPSGTDYLRAMLAYEDSTVSYGTNEDVVDTMTVYDPVHRNSPESGPITVSYARKAADVDYDYPETRDPETNLEKVFLDMKGEVKLAKGHYFERLYQINARLQCVKSGTIFYNRKSAESDIKVSDDKTSFSWDLNNDWNNCIPESVRYGNREHSFDFQIQFYCSGDDTRHKIIVSSDDYPEMRDLKSYTKISKIRLYWGCVAEDTDILMADGTTKKAKDITEGDRVKDKDGNANSVTKITTGTSRIIYHLKLVSGQELTATDAHPIYTDNGFVALIDINTSSKLLNADGVYSDVLYCYPEENYSGKVYSFDLQSGNTLCTNGIITGTGEEQGKLSDVAEDNGSEHDPKVLEEIARMKSDIVKSAFLGQGG